MALKITDITTIKNWFKTGLKPTQTQFWSTWDSFWHKSESLPISSITNLANLLDSKAEENHEHNQYAKNDATSLTADNVTAWQQKLGVADLKFDDKAITITQDYTDFGLVAGDSINAFNNAIYSEVAKKIDVPTENATNEYVLMADGSVVAKSEFGKVDKVMGVSPDVNKNVDISGVAMNWTNASQRMSALVSKHNDATYKRLLGMDANGNLNEVGIIALINEVTKATNDQKVALMRQMNGEYYSSGQITVSFIMLPIIKKQLDGITTVKVLGTNLLINPETSYVRIKEKGNSSVFADCTFTNLNSTELLVNIPNYILEIGKDYILEIKHGIQLHETVEYITCVGDLVKKDISSTTWQVITANTTIEPNYSPPEVVIDGINVKVRQNNQAKPNIAGVVTSLASSKLFNQGDNFILELTVDLTVAYSMSSNFVGIGYSSKDITLNNNSINSISALGVYSGVPFWGANIYRHNTNLGRHADGLHIIKITFIKRGNELITFLGNGMSRNIIVDNDGYRLNINLSQCLNLRNDLIYLAFDSATTF